MGFQNTGYIYCGAPPAGHGGLLYKLFENANRIVTREACVRDCMRFRRQQV